MRWRPTTRLADPNSTRTPEEQERVAHQSKMLSKSIVLFTATTVRDELITIDRDEIRHLISIFRVILAHTRRVQRSRRQNRGRCRTRKQASNVVHVIQKQLARSTWCSGLDTLSPRRHGNRQENCQKLCMIAISGGCLMRSLIG